MGQSFGWGGVGGRGNGSSLTPPPAGVGGYSHGREGRKGREEGEEREDLGHHEGSPRDEMHEEPIQEPSFFLKCRGKVSPCQNKCYLACLRCLGHLLTSARLEVRTVSRERAHNTRVLLPSDLILSSHLFYCEHKALFKLQTATVPIPEMLKENQKHQESGLGLSR